MRAVVIKAPGVAHVTEVHAPWPGPGDALVEVHRVGVCGTDEELFDGSMAYFATGRSTYPLRPGHEWAGAVIAVGDGVDEAWVGRRVTGDTMLACGRCDRCTTGRRHVCRDLAELGISRGVDGALAEQLVVPVRNLHHLPDPVDEVAGALVEPGGNAWRASSAALAGPGKRILVWGTGAIGLLTIAFAAAEGAEVHAVSRHPERSDLPQRLGASAVWRPTELPDLPFYAVIDATDDASVPAAAVARVEPGGRVVGIGLSGRPSQVDTRDLVLRDVSFVGILSGSPGLAPAIEHYARGSVDPRPLVGATVGLDEGPAVLAREVRRVGGPKVHIDPRR